MTWMNTFSNAKFDIMNLEESQVFLDDIAHALSNLCRYQGHCRTFYSVAEHSINVASLLPQHLKLAGLLHDASETYIGDMIRPHKKLFPDYQELEKEIESLIFRRFNLTVTPLDWEVIKKADDTVLFCEKRVLFPDTSIDWQLPPIEEDVDIKIIGHHPMTARALFLKTYHHLTLRYDDGY